MANGNGHSLASIVTTVGEAIKHPGLAAALFLAGVFFNYYMSAQKVQEHSTQIQQNVEEIKKLKEQSITKDEFNRSQQLFREDAIRAQQNQADAFRSLGDKIDRVNSRIDVILQRE